MMRFRLPVRQPLLLGLVLLLAAGLVYGQFGFGRRVVIQQNDPPPTEFVIARWSFNTNGRIGHTGWTHNYPYSEQHLNQLLSEVTSVNVDRMSYRVVALDSDEIFDYPMAYVSEPGEMDMTPDEVGNFRQYVSRGGFIIVDDFDGDHIVNLSSQVKLAFPDRELLPVNVGHELFHSFYSTESLEIFAPYVTGGRPGYYVLTNPTGDVAMIALWNNDLANFWDWIDEARYPLEPSTEAFRMGINFVIYAMTH
jgi:hypothetical protein